MLFLPKRPSELGPGRTIRSSYTKSQKSYANGDPYLQYLQLLLGSTSAILYERIGRYPTVLAR
jgi:hypothetical protein